MLEGREIEHIIIGAIGLDKGVIFNGADIQGKRLEITIDITKRASDIAHQLDHVVLADIDNMQFTWISLEDLLGYRLAYSPCATEHQEPRIRHDATH